MDKELRAQREELKTYLSMKVRAEDWHGVADAAMDLREVDAQLQLIEKQRQAIREMDGPSK